MVNGNQGRDSKNRRQNNRPSVEPQQRKYKEQKRNIDGHACHDQRNELRQTVHFAESHCDRGSRSGRVDHFDFDELPHNGSLNRCT